MRALMAALAFAFAVSGYAAEPAQTEPSRISKPTPTVALNPTAYFKWFQYRGQDAAFEQAAPPGTYRNPVLAGFYPDPSVTRVGDTFYLVNSTFTFFPGIPVFASRDLVHWRQIGNVIDRPRELDFDGKDVSRGIFAPTIRHHNGLFYVITTAVDSGGNQLYVARNPAGPWSDPIPLAGLEGGIDPSLFFDEDGKAYVLNNGLPQGGSKYEGHRAIWIQQLDLGARKLVGPRKMLINGGVNLAKKPIWIEGPHVYKHDGWYLLMCAEGGTSTQHSEVVLRARSPWGPFKPFKGNPILTQRDLPPDRLNPITNAGHADLVEGPDGTWWAVFLASRPYDGVHYNTGRETFLLPVTWHDGWPIILPAGKPIPYVVTAPKFGDANSNASGGPTNASGAPASATYTPTTGNFTLYDDFKSPVLNQQWLYVRTPETNWADLTQRPGWLSIHALRAGLDSLQNMSFLARRQQHLSYDASTEIEAPASPGNVSVGLAAFQNQDYWYFLGLRRVSAERVQVFLEKRAGKQTETIATTDMTGDLIELRISARARDYSFYFNAGATGWKPLKEHADGSILSTDVAGGFVGAMVGPYARAD
ncbi:MAG: glycoside hydrolase family 43 protein [Proteobacteria bacterium]|nr:glycoside hydrolase family 43 protein [Pseudomonadota bacterium]